MEKSHIAVEFLVQKLSASKQRVIMAVNEILSSLLFVMISWRCIIYGSELRNSGEVSLTLQMPTYPFAFGIALGSALLSLVLFVDFLKSLRGVEKP